MENKNERIESPAPGEVRRTLRDYVQHKDWCACISHRRSDDGGQTFAFPPKDCTCGLDLLLSGEGRAPQAREVKLGVIELHSNQALRKRFYDVVSDLQEAACIVDLWLMDVASVLREHGYEMKVTKPTELQGEGRAQDEPRKEQEHCSCGCSKWRHQMLNLGGFGHCADCGCQRFQS